MGMRERNANLITLIVGLALLYVVAYELPARERNAYLKGICAAGEMERGASSDVADELCEERLTS